MKSGQIEARVVQSLTEKIIRAGWVGGEGRKSTKNFENFQPISTENFENFCAKYSKNFDNV